MLKETVQSIVEHANVCCLDLILILLQLQYRYNNILQMSLHVYKFQTKYSNIL